MFLPLGSVFNSKHLSNHLLTLLLCSYNSYLEMEANKSWIVLVRNFIIVLLFNIRAIIDIEEPQVGKFIAMHSYSTLIMSQNSQFCSGLALSIQCLAYTLRCVAMYHHH